MKEKIFEQVCSVLNKYDKNYSTNGVTVDLKAWERNKGWLVELLCHHPNWNEEALAVKIEVTQSREIDKATVNSYKYELSQLVCDLDLSEDEQNNFNQSLAAVAFTYSKILPETDTAALVKQKSGITCSAGQKTNRIINALCKNMGWTNIRNIMHSLPNWQMR